MTAPISQGKFPLSYAGGFSLKLDGFMMDVVYLTCAFGSLDEPIN